MTRKNYRASRDIPLAVRESNSMNDSTIAEWILKNRNKEVSEVSIRVWMSRHPEVKEQLENHVVSNQVDEKEVTPEMFENGTFYELPSVKEWVTLMKDRDVIAIPNMVGILKQLCQGVFPVWGLNFDMPLIHPDRLTQDDVMNIIRFLKDHGKRTQNFRLVARNFLHDTNRPYSKISGMKEGFGKYADLYVSPENCYKMLNDLKAMNFEAYVCSLFMYKTATRISATLNARIENIRKEENTYMITLWDKGRRAKYNREKGKRWVKPIPQDLMNEIKTLIGDRDSGPIFNISRSEVNNLNRTVIERHSGNMLKRHPEFRNWNHFWRHMYAQHMLRKAEWNYTIVASLGGWSPSALEESYGKPPTAIVKQWGTKYIL